MRLSDKLRSLRGIEGGLRNLGRPMTQGELVRALREEMDGSLSQSYLSQIESRARPHLTNTSRQLLARFFKVHPGYLVDDPEGYHPELLSDLRHETADDKLDTWLTVGAERFSADPELCRALRRIADHRDSRRCLLALGDMLQSPELAERSFDGLQGSHAPAAFEDSDRDFSEAGLPVCTASRHHEPLRIGGDRR